MRRIGTQAKRRAEREDDWVRAAVFYGPGDIRVEDVSIPRVGRGDMLVRVRAAAICGTDLRAFASGFNRPELQGSSGGRILGHELAGDVVELGEGVEGFKAGDRVTIAPNIGCGTCSECVRGLDHLCRRCTAVGVALNGGFAEYVLFPARAVARGNVCTVPEGLSYEEAAVNEALACCLNGQEACRVTPGDVVLIVGAGPVGVLHLLLARFSGARKVIVSDVSGDRLAEARRVAPDAVFVLARDVEAAVSTETGGRGADVIIVACSSADAQRQSLEFAALGARINFFGGLPRGKDAVTLSTNLIHYRQLIVTGTTGSSTHQFRRALEILASRKVDARSVITNRYALDEVRQAFEAARSLKGLRTVILP